jgi:hypothetical protein
MEKCKSYNAAVCLELKENNLWYYDTCPVGQDLKMTMLKVIQSRLLGPHGGDLIPVINPPGLFTNFRKVMFGFISALMEQLWTRRQ